MSDTQFTLFELHFDDGVQLGPRTLGDGPRTGAEESTTESDSTAAESDDSGGDVLGPLVGLGLLATAAYAVRELLREDPDGIDALDDVEADAETAAEESVPIEITTPDETDGRRTGLLVAAAVGLLLILAVAARKLLGGSEEIVVRE